MTREEKIFLDFLSAVNLHDCRPMEMLMADDAVLINEQGKRVNGQENIKFLWTEHFIKFPDYTIELTTLFVNGNWVGGFGFACATPGLPTREKKTFWELPVALSALIENAKIKEWHVYSDTMFHPFFWRSDWYDAFPGDHYLKISSN